MVYNHSSVIDAIFTTKVVTQYLVKLCLSLLFKQQHQKLQKISMSNVRDPSWPRKPAVDLRCYFYYTKNDHLDHSDGNGDGCLDADLVVKYFELRWQTIKHYLKTVRGHLFDAGSKYPIRRAVNPCSQLNG